jgi:hypothetical protein
LRVDYYAGLLRVATEWVCFSHIGYARQKAENWWMRREKKSMPSGTQEALQWIEFDGGIEEPVRIATRKNGKYTEVKDYEFN